LSLVTAGIDIDTWLRDTCGRYTFDLRGIFQASGDHPWPVSAADEAELDRIVSDGGHLLPLPKESAALANILEVGIVDFLLESIDAVPGLEARRGSERGYPDLEITGSAVGDRFHAVDIKVARRKSIKRGLSKNTDSRVTLYTGNTYFAYPELHWPGTPRPFADYASHLDIIVVYTLNRARTSRVDDLELIVQPAWKIASRQRSSTTREYIGAVVDLDALRTGQGECKTEAEFYKYWRSYNFRVGKAVAKQLQKLLAQQAKSRTT
jgi:hypothetical protein